MCFPTPVSLEAGGREVHEGRDLALVGYMRGEILLWWGTRERSCSGGVHEGRDLALVGYMRGEILLWWGT